MHRSPQPIPDNEDINITELAASLQLTQSVLRRKRWLFAVSMLTIGLVSTGASCVLEFLITSLYEDRSVSSHYEHQQTLTSNSFLMHVDFYYVCCMVLLFFRNVAFNLAPLADAMQLTRCVLAVDVVVQVYELVKLVTVWAPYEADYDCNHSSINVQNVQTLCSKGHILEVLRFGIYAAYMSALILHMCSTKVSVMQERMWRSLTIYFVSMIIWNGVCAVHIWIDWRIIAIPSIFYMAMATIISCTIIRPQTRQNVHAWLMRKFGAVGNSASAAAGIAGLIGDGSPEEMLREAAARFRCVDLSKLSYSDFLQSPLDEASPDLYGRTQTAVPGSCDAFISHSWHDCPEAKWIALQRWRSEFVIKNQREPLVWFDKCCIDQTNIDADLRCLPIWLSGCTELVILRGTTYMTRLWCIMELFTFAHMKGDPGRIVFLNVLRKAKEHEDLVDIEHEVATFDARSCTCFQSEDKEKMFGIIGAAFGSLDAFNDAIQKLLTSMV